MAPRKSYSAAEKLKVIAYAVKHGNTAARNSFGMNESNVRSWRKNKSKIEKMPKSKKALRTCAASHPALE